MNRLVLQAIYLIIHDLAVGFKKSGTESGDDYMGYNKGYGSF